MQICVNIIKVTLFTTYFGHSHEGKPENSKAYH